MTTIINVHIKDLKNLYNDNTMNLYKWMQNDNHLYIGRKGIIIYENKRFPNENSKWANPFKISKTETREIVLDKYKKYILENKQLYDSLEELDGKILGCWCHPEPCHGHVLIELLNEKKLKFMKNP